MQLIQVINNNIIILTIEQDSARGSVSLGTQCKLYNLEFIGLLSNNYLNSMPLLINFSLDSH